MEKVEEEDLELGYCSRCEKEHCSKCNPIREVDFDVKESNEEDGTGDMVNRKGERVCPFCYNQLIDKAQIPPTG